MYPYQTALNKRIDTLTAIIEAKTAALQNVPEETLRISGSVNRKQAQYYLYDSKKSRNGTYIPVNDDTLIKALAQKSYDSKVLHAAQKELHLLLRLKKQSADPSVEETYSRLSPRRQQLITPVYLPDDKYIEKWETQQFTPKGFAENAPEHYTSRGERVRSKSEILIADTLSALNIPYHYEMPLRLESVTIHPDFTILDVSTRRTLFLEHLGMMDDPVYANEAISRIHLYIRHGILPGDRLLLTFESKNNPLNTKILKLQLKGLQNNSFKNASAFLTRRG